MEQRGLQRFEQRSLRRISSLYELPNSRRPAKHNGGELVYSRLRSNAYMRMKRIHRVMMSRESNGKVAELGSQEGWRQVIYLTHPLDPGLEH